MGTQPGITNRLSRSYNNLRSDENLRPGENPRSCENPFSHSSAMGILSHEGPVPAEQAVFTSVPSATGSGYRLISASGGLTPEERQEITQRCPSHASLTDDGPSAEGLAAWRLRTGRSAVAWSRHAGAEHTGRGGLRVYTHLAIFDEPAYRRFENHPLRVYYAMLESLNEEPLLNAPPTLEPLLLPDPAGATPTWLSAIGIGCRHEAIFAMLEAMLEGRTLIVTGLKSPVAALDATLAVLPLSHRPEVSVSIGLKYAPSRQARLTTLEGDCADARRLTRGQSVQWLDAGTLSPGASAGPAQGWAALVRQWWTNGRRKELCQLAAGIDFDAPPEVLNRIATVCNHADTAAKGDPAVVQELAARYGSFRPTNPVEAELVNQLLATATTRLGS